jgi:hypothetical protein
MRRGKPLTQRRTVLIERASSAKAVIQIEHERLEGSAIALVRERLTSRDPSTLFVHANRARIVHKNVKHRLSESGRARIVDKGGENLRAEALALIAWVDGDEPKIGGARRVIGIAASRRRQMSKRGHSLIALNDSP